MAYTYTQFVVGFEFASIFWLLMALVEYLYKRAIEGHRGQAKEGKTKTVQEQLVHEETVDTVVALPAVPLSIVPISFYKSLNGVVPILATEPKDLVTLDEEFLAGTDVDITTDFWTGQRLPQAAISGVQHSLQVLEEVSLTEECLVAEAPNQVRIGLDITDLKVKIQGLSIRQAKALAKQLKHTDARIIGYGNLCLKTLIAELTTHERLQYIAKEVDISSLQILATTAKTTRKRTTTTLIQ